MIKIENIYKSYGDLNELCGLSKDIEHVEEESNIVPSGTGKSTFLRCINYLEAAEQGTIRFDDEMYHLDHMTKKQIKSLRLHSSMVFQDYNLFKNKTALENIMEHLVYVKKIEKEKAEEIRKSVVYE